MHIYRLITFRIKLIQHNEYKAERDGCDKERKERAKWERSFKAILNRAAGAFTAFRAPRTAWITAIVTTLRTAFAAIATGLAAIPAAFTTVMHLKLFSNIINFEIIKIVIWGLKLFFKKKFRIKI